MGLQVVSEASEGLRITRLWEVLQRAWSGCARMQNPISVKGHRPDSCWQPKYYRNLHQDRSYIENLSVRGHRGSCRWVTRGQRMLPQAIWIGVMCDWILHVSFVFVLGHRTQVRRRSHLWKCHWTDRRWIRGAGSALLLVVDLASRKTFERGLAIASTSSPRTCWICVTHRERMSRIARRYHLRVIAFVFIRWR